MRKIELRALQSVFKAGDLSEDIFFLTKGEVGIFLPDNNTKEPNFIIGENEIFGEMG
ncbi:MAG: cyclic nucleotide-binding domain-containing protein, partial [Candidatus Puniceispirillum sp.]|nr:cyclic nucleotide-binding domain-containing protein [Candidatus Puniceispirillum sp.]